MERSRAYLTGELVSCRQAAEIKGVTQESVYRAISDQRLPAIKIDTFWLIHRLDLDQWTIWGHKPPRKRKESTRARRGYLRGVSSGLPVDGQKLAKL